MSKKGFSHEIGELVLVKWDDGMVYFAKIKQIDWRKRRCVVIFDDKSTDKASFSQIHSVDETTTDIICIKCKKDNSENPNEIVLCDGCGIGFHQKCHSPAIPASALELDNPWKCLYCVKSLKNPYLTESIDVLQSLFEEDSNDSEECNGSSVTHQNRQQGKNHTGDRNTTSDGQPAESNSTGFRIKQEVLSDDESTSMEQETLQTQKQQPQTIVTQSPKKKKPRGRPPKLFSNNANKKSVQPAKKRPLQELRRKFARSRLGRNASVSSMSHRRSTQDSTSNVTTPVMMEDNNDTNEGDNILGITVTRQSVGGSFNLRKRKATNQDIDNVSSSNSSSTTSSDSSDGNDSYNEESLELDDVMGEERQQHSSNKIKRPRSLRVSLTLPPSVETTPICTRATPLTVVSRLPSPPAPVSTVTTPPLATSPVLMEESKEIINEEPPHADKELSTNSNSSTSIKNEQPPTPLINTTSTAMEDKSPIVSDNIACTTGTDTECSSGENPSIEPIQVPAQQETTTQEEIEPTVEPSPTIESSTSTTDRLPSTTTDSSTYENNVSNAGDCNNMSNEPPTACSNAVEADKIYTSSPAAASTVSSTSSAPESSMNNTDDHGDTDKKRSSSVSSVVSDDSLVKVSPGVTQLKPTKHKRPSVISDDPLPAVVTSSNTVLSPLEKLRNEIVASKKLEMQAMRANRAANIGLGPSPATTILQSITGIITSAPPIQSNSISHHSRKSSVPSRASVAVSEVTSTNCIASQAPPAPPKTVSTTIEQQSKQKPNNLIVISPSPSPPPSAPQVPPPSLPSGGPSTHPQLMAYYINHKGPQMQSASMAGDIGRSELAGDLKHLQQSKVSEHASEGKKPLSLPPLKQHQSKGFVTFHHSYKPSNKQQYSTTDPYKGAAASASRIHAAQQAQGSRSQSTTNKESIQSTVTASHGAPVIGHVPQSPIFKYQKPGTTRTPSMIQQQPAAAVMVTASSNSNPIHSSNQPPPAAVMHRQILPGNGSVYGAGSGLLPHQTASPGQSELAILTSPKSGDSATLYAIVTAASQAVYSATRGGYIMSTAPAAVQVAPHADIIPASGNHAVITPGGNQKGIVYGTIPVQAVGVPASTVLTSESGPQLIHQQYHQQGASIIGSDNHQPSIHTTKPYAVVNAIPTQQHTNEHPTAPPLYSPPPPSLKIPPPSTKQINSSEVTQKCTGVQEADSSSLRKRIQAQMREEATTDLTQRLHSFSNKYKDFDTLSADDLLDIFHGALKKFQRNSRMYDAYTGSRNRVVPPNVQVCSHPAGDGTTHPVTSSNVYTLYTSISHGSTGQGSQPPAQYIKMPSTHRIADNVVRSSSGRPHQVHTSGVFVPPLSDKGVSETVAVPVHKTAQPPPAKHQHQNPQMVKIVTQEHESTAGHKSSTPMGSTASITARISTPPSTTVNMNNSCVVTSSIVGNTSSLSNHTTATTNQQQNIGVSKPSSEKRRRKPEAPNQIRTLQVAGTPQNITAEATVILKPHEPWPTPPNTAATTTSQRICARCGKHATFLCSGCHKIWYCGRDCQVTSWTQHSASCKAITN